MAINDTHPKLAALQLELMRGASSEQRLALMNAYSSELIALSRRTIAARIPDALEVKLEWVRVHYGPELADRLRKYCHAPA